MCVTRGNPQRLVLLYAYCKRGGLLSLSLGITILADPEKPADNWRAKLRLNMKVYLDNSVIGRFMDIERGIKRGSKMLEEDVIILPNLIRLCADKGIQVCASDDAGAEIEKLRSTMPYLTDALISKLQSFTLLPIRHAIKWDDGHHWGMGSTWPGDSPSNVDLLVQELKAFLLSKTRITKEAKREAVEWDAYHLAVSKDNGCDIFLTCDYASIWTYRKFLRKDFSIEVRRPVEFFEQICSHKNE